MMAHVLATAEDFAFGPTGKLITVAAALAQSGHRITFAGYGTAYQLARKADWWKVLERDTKEFCVANADGMLDDVDLVLSCLDEPSARGALALGIPVVWLDPLAWWWETQPDWIADVDLHIVQRSISNTVLTATTSKSSANQILVGPVVGLASQQTLTPSRTGLLVNFGGGEAAGWYEIGKDTEYPYVIAEILQSVALARFASITVTCNERVATTCAERWPCSGFRFACLDHQEFLDTLATSSVFLTVPGLEAPLEAWTHGVPTVFLPPSNSSQYVQLDEFRQQGVAGASIHLRDYLPGLDLMSLTLRQRSQTFLGQLREFELSPALHDRVGVRLTDMLSNARAFGAMVSAGTRYIDSLGGNGLSACLAAIENLIARRTRG
jgi:hypothetical protein